jgi:hypothetical protein
MADMGKRALPPDKKRVFLGVKIAPRTREFIENFPGLNSGRKLDRIIDNYRSTNTMPMISSDPIFPYLGKR